MPTWKYSVQGLDPDKTALASGRDLRIKPKVAREICHHIKGMKLEDAKGFLADVIELKKPVPYYRYRGKVPHRKGLQGHDAGRFPEKAAQEILKILVQVLEHLVGFPEVERTCEHKRTAGMVVERICAGV